MTTTTQRDRRAASLVYLSVALVALSGIVSLAVDLGRVRWVKAELQLEADAAYRHAVSHLGDGVTGASLAAVDAADDNRADGTAVALDATQDVEFGTWDAGTLPRRGAREGGNGTSPNRPVPFIAPASAAAAPLMLLAVEVVLGGVRHLDLFTHEVARVGGSQAAVQRLRASRQKVGRERKPQIGTDRHRWDRSVDPLTTCVHPCNLWLILSLACGAVRPALPGRVILPARRPPGTCTSS